MTSIVTKFNSEILTFKNFLNGCGAYTSGKCGGVHHIQATFATKTS